MPAEAPETVPVLVIDAPPVDGFVPHIAVATTDAKKSFDEWDATPSAVIGNYTFADPHINYGFGLFDTGAGVSVISHANADRFNVLTQYTFNTGLFVEVGGVTGSVDAWVSQPIGLWMAGLGAIDKSTLELDTSALVGEWNVSVAMGQVPAPGAPDIATAIGSPMAVFYETLIRNDLTHTVERDGETYTGPDITFYNLDDPAAPDYPNSVPLELRPAGAAAVYYWPCFASLQYCPGGDGSPSLPSFLIGVSSQSLYFASSVSLGDNGNSAMDRDGFMVDTGAQVTVLGSSLAAVLGLNPNQPEFVVEIEGVDGQVIDAPGFYIDTLGIAAIGEWLTYTNTPVILLDIASPEGGTLEGIIGMNLLTRYNFVFRGGGLSGGLPWLDFEALPPINADYDGDGDIDSVDFAYLQTCMTAEGVPQTDLYCEGAFLDGDSDIDQHDLDLFVDCARGPAVTPPPYCTGG